MIKREEEASTLTIIYRIGGKGETSRLPNLTCHLHAVPIKFILNFTNNNVRRKFQIRGPKLFIVTYKWRILNQGVPCKYYKTS